MINDLQLRPEPPEALKILGKAFDNSILLNKIWHANGKRTQVTQIQVGLGGRSRSSRQTLLNTGSPENKRDVIGSNGRLVDADRSQVSIGAEPNTVWNNRHAANGPNARHDHVTRVRARSLTSAGSPLVYIADCHSAPDSGVPTGLASMAPTTALSTYSR